MPASVSVILPCFNGAGTLRHALTSIVKQTYADWQLILLDDNSTDDSVAIANAFHEPRFRIIEGTDTRGISHRLNDLVAEVDSEYLARMDVDDIMHPQRLQEQVAFLQSHADVDIVGSSIVTIDRLNQVRAWRCPPLRVESPLRILKGEVLYHPAIAGRTSFFKRHPYPTDYTCEDFALWAKSADILTIRNLPAPLLFYREEGFFTFRKYISRSRDTRRVLRRFGPPIIGHINTHLLVARRCLKDAVYLFLFATGMWDRASSLVNQPMPAHDRQEHQRVLDGIIDESQEKAGSPPQG